MKPLLPMRPAEKKALFVAETLPALDLDLAALGYPGFSYLTTRRPKKNPAEVLFAALGAKHLDSRVIEALPWIADALGGLSQREVDTLYKLLGKVKQHLNQPHHESLTEVA